MQNSSWGLGGRPLRVAASFNMFFKQIVIIKNTRKANQIDGESSNRRHSEAIPPMRHVSAEHTSPKG